MNSRTKRLEILKHQAVSLRREGKTFTEIQAEIGAIAKGTLSGWVKNIELTTEQKQRIKEISKQQGQAGRLAGAWANHQKRVERLDSLRNEANKEYGRLVHTNYFLTGLVLYLAEGSKKAEIFQFMNSDLYLIRIMINWIVGVSELELSDLRFRLYVHKQYADEACEAFWQRELQATPEQFLKTIYKPSLRVYKKNPSYKGCLRIEVRGTALYWKTMAWRDCLYESMR